MSGGIAYVWNPNKNVDYYVNMDLVELTLLKEEDEIAELRNLIERHVKYTGSKLGKHMLENWEEFIPQFIKVTPVEYKKIALGK